MISAGEAVTVRIPAGEYGGEKVKPLRIDQSEVTNGLAAKVAKKLSDEIEVPFGQNQKEVLDAYYEAMGIGWFEKMTGWGLFGRTPTAQRFSLSEKREGFEGDNQPRIDASGKMARAICEARGMRLLTPTEWKYAAGGPNHFDFSSRNGKFDEVGIHSSVKQAQTATRDVGSGKGHYVQWGGVELYDMSGSVWEWVYDSANDVYSVCGGSWYNDDPGNLRADYCFASNSGNSGSHVGFRCASPEDF